MIIWWSVLINDRGVTKRIGMVCYWRLSIDVYVKERSKHEKYLLFAQEKNQHD